MYFNITAADSAILMRFTALTKGAMKMEMITISDAQKITSPNPFVLIAAKKPDGTTNLMALSWWSYLSNHPATIGVCTSNRGYTGELIKEAGEFCLCVPDVSVKDSAIRCGTCSGRENNKAEMFGIELEDAETVDAKIVRKSALVLECKLKNTVDVGDHTLYIAEVSSCRADRAFTPVFAVDGYKRLSEVTYM